MRLWQLALLIVLFAVVSTIARDQVGRVALIVFCTGLVEFGLATLALLTLFRTVGAIGQASRFSAYAEAVLATAGVLVVASVSMNAVLWLGLRLLQIATS